MFISENLNLYLKSDIIPKSGVNKMKARSELNQLLYRIKMDGKTISDKTTQNMNMITGGDTDAVSTQLKNCELIFTDDRILSKNELRNTIHHFILFADAVSSACMQNGMGSTEAYTLAGLYILKADECHTSDSVHIVFEDMCMDFAERMQEIRKDSVISLHIRRCIDYIYENLGADLRIKTLAEKAQLDPAYLSRLFRKETGISLKQFVKEARVDTAQNLLRYSDLSYPVISSSLGFSSQSAFIAVFKDITGMTPKVYRERYYTKQSMNTALP